MSSSPIAPDLLKQIANTIRFLAADGVEKAKSGHPGMPMGCADIAAVLMARFLRLDPNDPKWINRDRFVLSAGHGSMLLYAMLYLAGFLTIDDLKNFRQLGSRTPGHPEYGETPGVETTGGPLGAGFATAAGMALAERMLAERYNTPKYEIIDHDTYVLMGDGCHMEGVTNEAASMAGHLRLHKLIAIYDDNEISIEGATSLAFSENVNARYEALGWHVVDVPNGHDHEAIANAIAAARAVGDRPSLIVVHTTIGYGAPHKQGTHHCHGEPLGEQEVKAAKEALGWPLEPFYVPEAVFAWREQRRAEWAEMRAQWDRDFEKYKAAHDKIAKDLARVMAGERPKQWKNAIPQFAAGESIATRVAGGKVMNAFAAVMPELAGGSADLAPSTKTELTASQYPDFIAPQMYLGSNIHFGVREHAMGHMVNGLALHGGFISFGATFLVFHDYMRPAVRLAALMKIPSIFVYTHDSIFVGEDGPTHQPVEHLAALRCIPRLHVFRPGDANETAWAWQYALERKDGPTAICLSRQNLPVLDRQKYAKAEHTLKGGYILEPGEDKAGEIAIIASGSEIHLALEVAAMLREAGRNVRVVSMPCLDLFREQAQNYQQIVLPKRIKKRVVIEAGVRQGWEGILGDDGVFIGMDDFGASGPYKSLAEKFGFIADKVIDRLAEAGF